MSSLEKRWILLIVLGTVASYLWMLGKMPLAADEGVRSTVALEMIFRDNYLVPTLFGEFYYRKPPLYNWLIIAFFKIFSSYSLFVFRLPSVLPLFLFGASIWSVSRKHIGESAAILAGLAYVLCGRMMIYSSLLGHIDIFYSWLTFLGFYIIYKNFKAENWWRLFLLSYLITAAGVLMKGLPSFLFQGFTLLAWFAWNNKIKKLFSLEHAAGIALLIVLVGGYFLAYTQYNELNEYFFQLYKQSSQRTVMEKAWYESILNILTFPLENLGHLFPTSLILLFLFKRGNWKVWKGSSFLTFTLICLLVNLPPYWLSPGYMPRYLFMLYPLVFILGAEAFFRNRNVMPRMRVFFNSIVVLIGILLIAGFIYAPLSGEVDFVSALWLKSILLLFASILSLLAFYKMKSARVWIFLFMLVIFRFGFDAFVLPHRLYAEKNPDQDERIHAINMLALSEERSIYVYKDSPVNTFFAFYLGRDKNQLIARKHDFSQDALYITVPELVSEHDYEELYRFTMKHEGVVLILIDPINIKDNK